MIIIVFSHDDSLFDSPVNIDVDRITAVCSDNSMSRRIGVLQSEELNSHYSSLMQKLLHAFFSIAGIDLVFCPIDRKIFFVHDPGTSFISCSRNNPSLPPW